MRSAINPIGSSKHSFELKGPHAKIQSHVPSPVIYVDIDEGALNDIPVNGRFRIVRVDVRKDTRIVGNLKVTFTGKTSQEGNFIRHERGKDRNRRVGQGDTGPGRCHPASMRWWKCSGRRK